LKAIAFKPFYDSRKVLGEHGRGGRKLAFLPLFHVLLAKNEPKITFAHMHSKKRLLFFKNKKS
jgi:hypothetical protein